VSFPSAGTAEAPSPVAPVGAHRRYWVGGQLSAITIGVYAFLILILYFVVLRSPAISYPEGIEFVIALTVFFLVRYLSTSYSIDDEYLRTFRIAGGRRIRLADVRKIEYTRLRDLSPTGFFGAWGWRGRMWSPVIGPFDAVYTDPTGILVTAGEFPIFISPRHTADFARELSRRVRSYTGPLAVDAGQPGGSF
jgi:hypothetical protein